MYLTFDARGHFVALAFFAALLLVLVAAFLVHLRQSRGTTVGVSRRTKSIAFLGFAGVYLATLHGWLFWRTFFELHADPRAGRLELVLRAPERRVAWPLAEVASIGVMPTYKLGYHLVVETAEGRRYESPRLDADEARRALDALRPLRKEKAALCSSAHHARQAQHLPHRPDGLGQDRRRQVPGAGDRRAVHGQRP